MRSRSGASAASSRASGASAVLAAAAALLAIRCCPDLAKRICKAPAGASLRHPTSLVTRAPTASKPLGVPPGVGLSDRSPVCFFFVFALLVARLDALPAFLRHLFATLALAPRLPAPSLQELRLGIAPPCAHGLRIGFPARK